MNDKHLFSTLLAMSFLIAFSVLAQSEDPKSGWLVDNGYRLNWVTDHNGVAVTWRHLADGSPPDGEIDESTIAISAELFNRQITDGIRIFPFEKSGLRSVVLVVFETRNSKYLSLQLKALAPLIAMTSLQHQRWQLATSNPKHKVFAELTSNDQLEAEVSKVLRLPPPVDIQDTGITVLLEAISHLTIQPELRKALIISESLLSTLNESSAGQFVEAAIQNDIAVYPLVMARDSNDFGWTIDLVRVTGGRVLPWVGKPPEFEPAALALKDFTSGGMAIFPTQSFYKLPLETAPSATVQFTNNEISTSFIVPVSVKEADLWTLLDPREWITWLTTETRWYYALAPLPPVMILALLIGLLHHYGNRPPVIAELAVRGSEVIHSVKQLPYIIGRSQTADLQVDNETVSLQHASIEEADNGGFCIRDLDSTNGTFIDDAPVQIARLGFVEKIKVGNQTIDFHLKKI